MDGAAPAVLCSININHITYCIFVRVYTIISAVAKTWATTTTTCFALPPLRYVVCSMRCCHSFSLENINLSACTQKTNWEFTAFTSCSFRPCLSLSLAFLVFSSRQQFYFSVKHFSNCVCLAYKTYYHLTSLMANLDRKWIPLDAFKK